MLPTRDTLGSDFKMLGKYSSWFVLVIAFYRKTTLSMVLNGDRKTIQK